MPVEHSGEDNRTVAQFSDAELMPRHKVGIAPIESDEPRPEGEPPD
jgi:hypothetical protein